MNQIVIVGAGIAGLTLATALRQRNIEVLVLERRTDLSSQGGAYLTISGQAIDQLISIGVSEELRHVGVAVKKIVRAGSGKSSGAPLPVTDSGTEFRHLWRADLIDYLAQSATEAGAKIETGMDVVSVVSNGDRATVSTSGRDVQAQFVFGCDGVGSAVRSSNPLTGPDATYQGQTVIYAHIPTADASEEAGVLSFLKENFDGGLGDDTLGYLNGDGGQGLFWFARLAAEGPLPKSECGRQSIENWSDVLTRRLGFAELTPSLLERTNEVFVANATAHDNMPSWRSGRTMVIGDAAHAASPASGSGATEAIGDALAVATALAAGLEHGSSLEDSLDGVAQARTAALASRRR
jgi:FAD-dependent urate hydroxylase